jgi:hypothetical protein
LAHSCCSHCRKTTVFPVGGLEGSAPVTGIVVENVVAALIYDSAAATAAEVPPGAALDVSAVELDFDALPDELHAATAMTVTAKAALVSVFALT